MRCLLLLLTSLFTLSLSANEVTYSNNALEYQGHYLSGEKGAPLVFLIHDWDGLTGYEVKRSKMLNKLGYSVFAADLFGKGVRPTKRKDKKAHTGELYKDRKKMRSILQSAIRKAKELGLNTSNMVATGYCFGGAAVLELARSGQKLKGVVSFHGGLKTPKNQNYKKANGKILIFHGTADSAIPMDQFASLASQLEKSKIQHSMITFGGARHAFTVFGGKKYHKEADQKSWSMFKSFLKETTK